MDFWSVFLIFLLTFLIMSCCGYCCVTKRRGAVLSTPIVVTSATHTSPGGYPVTQTQAPYPQFQNYQPATNNIAQYPPNMTQSPYPPQNMAPYPMHGAPSQMPMPAQPMQTAYLSAPSMNPPSYDLATGGSTAQNNTIPNAPYEKQSPYNPSYTT